jgi:hypothetical protein
MLTASAGVELIWPTTSYYISIKCDMYEFIEHFMSYLLADTPIFFFNPTDCYKTEPVTLFNIQNVVEHVIRTDTSTGIS